MVSGSRWPAKDGKSVPGQRRERLMRDFGRRLRAARITAGYEEAAEFAAAIGIEPPRYRKYERGDSMPPLDVLEGILLRTGVTADWLLLGPEHE